MVWWQLVRIVAAETVAGAGKVVTNGYCWGVVVTPPYLLKLKTGNCDVCLM